MYNLPFTHFDSFLQVNSSLQKKKLSLQPSFCYKICVSEVQSMLEIAMLSISNHTVL